MGALRAGDQEPRCRERERYRERNARHLGSVFALAIRVAGEAVRVGLAQGFALETINGFAPDEWVGALDGDRALWTRMEEAMEASTARRSEAFIPSMAQDVNKGRRTEIDFINGLVVDKAAEIGLEAPANEGLARVVRRVERGEAAPALALLEGF